jgi:site-specific DNA-methyltransferase (adenine-specific)
MSETMSNPDSFSRGATPSRTPGKSYNPDVLTCLANLSNDEVFTPPILVNQILDILPVELWSNRDAKFLDPVSKSGVFLREIAKRLMVGLEKQIPDKQERINHIYKHQLYGIAITELTSLLSRRSVYCSKTANGKYSVCETFDNEKGNIIFDRIKHNWQNGKCTYCGASQEVYDRDDALETHSYQFIHTENPEKLFNMKFDVIVGNPPYQLNDGGGMGTSATPIYQKFVQQAKKLNPRYLSMIIPSRWFAGGKGLDEFREEMLNDNRISKIVDFFDSTECFPGVDISGGVCFFLWEKEYSGICEVTSILKEKRSIMERPLLEKDCDSFIRFNEAISILRKIQSFKEESILKQISSRKPFGLIAAVKSFENPFKDSVKLYSYPKNGYISRKQITQNIQWVDEYKVFIAKAYGERGSFPYRVIGKPFVGEQNSCSSETYLVIGPYSTEKKTENVISYINTRFFRFLVLFKKNTQNAAKGVYSFVPSQNFEESWTDEKLYQKYGLTAEEIEFIESMIRPMNLE